MPLALKFYQYLINTPQLVGKLQKDRGLPLQETNEIKDRKLNKSMKEMPKKKL